MNNYYHPLILGGIASIFFGVQPSLLASSKAIDSHSEENPVSEQTFEILDSSVASLPLSSDQSFSIDTMGKELNESSSIETSSLNFPLPENENLKDKELITQNSPLISQPEIIIQEKDTEILQPSTPAYPVLPRAVAPPVGDMAVSNIDAMADSIDLGTSAIIPRLVLREAPAREVLAVLARYAGFNLIFTDTPGAAPQGPEGAATAVAASQTVSLDLENESVQEVFNSVLMVSGLKANRRGRTIFVGAALPSAARNLITRTLRLNQIGSVNAATFLAAQGAEYQRLVTQTEDIVDPLTGRVVGRRETPPTLEPLTVTQQQGSSAPFLLQGLTVAADERLNSISLIGEPRQVEIATSMLVQLDARRRQVAVNVKVVDVQLIGSEFYNSSFSFGFDDGFFVNDGGTAILNFGNYNPPNAAQTRGSVTTPPVIGVDEALGGLIPSVFFDVQGSAPFSTFNQGIEQFLGSTVPYSRPSFGTNNNPFQPGVSDISFTRDDDGNITDIQYEYEIPNLFQFPQKFLLTLEAQITSGNAKILTDPTLVVQEGQQATVKLTQKVVESVNTQVDPLSGVRTTTPVLQDAGLTLTVEVDRIDDNGFVSLFVSPTIAAPGSITEFESGDGTTNQLTLLTRRELTSGLIRMRDGQTLILSGIISETEQTTVSKIPILGDIPILGALFRRTDNSGTRSEVIVLLTPKIIDDRPDSSFGFNYSPGPEAAEMLRRQGFPVQPR